MKINNEYSHNGDLVYVVEIIDDNTVVVSNEDAASETEVDVSELRPRDEAVRGFWDS
jgi:hypothetical protein